MRRVKPLSGLQFDEDARELAQIETLYGSCMHSEWRWLDCEPCREEIGECGEKVCAACGATL